MKIRSNEANHDTAFAQSCEVSGHTRLLFISGQVPED